MTSRRQSSERRTPLTIEISLLLSGVSVAVNLTDGAKSSGTGASNTTTVKSNAKVDVAHGFNKSLAGTYKVTASGLNLRAGAGTGKSILAVMKNGEKVQCYGYYNDCNGVKKEDGIRKRVSSLCYNGFMNVLEFWQSTHPAKLLNS